MIAVEDFFGAGACFALAADARRRPGLRRGRRRSTPRREAFDAAGWLLDKYGCSRLIVGASLEHDPRAVELGAELAGARETAVGLPLLRSLLAEGRLVHFQAGSVDRAARRVPGHGTASGQLSLVAGPRSDVIRATAWALYSLEQNPPLCSRESSDHDKQLFLINGFFMLSRIWFRFFL